MDPSALDDIHLMGSVRAGDRDAFARLFDRHGPAVLGLLMRILGSRSEAEEVLQDTFLQVWRQAGRYEPMRATPRGWILVLARSRALDVLRSRESRRRRESELSADATQSPTHAGPLGSERIEAEEWREQVHSALDLLPAEQRRCIELAFFEGLTQSQIARQLDAPLGTVKSRIHLGMSKLREALGELTMAIRHSAEIAELLPIHALGALDGADLETMKAHLAEGCPECRRELERLDGDIEALAATLGPVVPSGAVRTRLLGALDDRDRTDVIFGRPESAVAPGRTAPGDSATPATPAAPVAPVTAPAPEVTRPRAPGAPPPRSVVATGRSAWTWLPLAAALALLVLSGLSFWNARREVDRLGTERERLARQVASLDRELAAARTEGRRLARALEVVSAPGMRPTVLASLGDRQGSGRAFLDPASKRAVFVASGLEPLPADRDYELWFIADGKPVAAGTFDVDASGNARIEVEDVAPPETIDAWAVTVEPAGGVPQPTGEMVLKG